MKARFYSAFIITLTQPCILPLTVRTRCRAGHGRRRRVGNVHSGRGRGTEINLFKEIRFPHSLGMLYAAFTYYLGFKVNDGEYKVMGLAPYGEPKYVQDIYDNLVDVKDDGSFRLNMKYFNYCTRAHDD